eukprot:gb/GEZN01011201.1/.p1 GENE.gb/GEZN01011201.1/~~gb/GEZN01011201.1/.p1  ORF type:complete len:350 (-),score=27.54 gb/GEZN01011201.1/:63-1112(-)
MMKSLRSLVFMMRNHSSDHASRARHLCRTVFRREQRALRVCRPSAVGLPGYAVGQIGNGVWGSGWLRPSVGLGGIFLAGSAWLTVETNSLCSRLEASSSSQTQQLQDDQQRQTSLYSGLEDFQSFFQAQATRIVNAPWQISVINALNLGVFLAWQHPRLSGVMRRHFTCSYNSVFRQGRVHTLITSVFSHQSGAHFLFNTVAITSLAPIIVPVVPSFFTLYLGMGLATSLTSTFWTGWAVLPRLRAASRAMPSLGASGVGFAFFAIVAAVMPTSQFLLMFIPYPIEAQNLLKGLTAFEVAGVLFSVFYTSPLGHACHLSGLLFGTAFYHYYLEQDMRRRQRAKRWQYWK